MNSTANNRLARIEILNYELIKKRDPTELARLLNAALPPPIGLGVFFLDLTGDSTSSIIPDLEKIYDGAGNFFQQSKETKLTAYRQGLERGFKSFDNIETFEISRDEEIEGTHKLPSQLSPASENFSSLSSTLDAITRDLVVSLSEKIGLATPFAAPDKSSESGLKLALISNKALTGEVIGAEHTDSGLITLLFYGAPTLELPVHGTSEWQLVKPVKGCAVVNIADSLQSKSGGRLFSPNHRVVQPEGENLSALYLLRPALE